MSNMRARNRVVVRVTSFSCKKDVILEPEWKIE